MKLIITAEGAGAESRIDPRFGRARSFVLYDSETDSYTTLDNTEQIQATQGAGIMAAQNVVASGADAVLTGRCGPKAFAVLAAADLEIYSGINGTVGNAIDQWRRGDLQRLTAPDGRPHHRAGRR